MFRFIQILLLFLLLTFVACIKDELEINVPDCVVKKVQEIKKEPVRNPPAQVWEWKVDDTIYFYITSDCCDQFNYLYNVECNVVCAPDGGLTGNGDGNCPDFSNVIEKTLVWEDDR